MCAKTGNYSFPRIYVIFVWQILHPFHSKKSLRTSKSLNGASFSTDISNPASSGRGSISVRTSSEKHKHKDDFSGKNNRTSNNSSDTDMELASELEKLKLQETANEVQKSQSEWNTIGTSGMDSAIGLHNNNHNNISVSRTFTK